MANNDSVSLDTLFDALTQADTFPHSCELITTIETHISAVFLTGQFAYKVKKPVNFGFLNFTELDERRRFCLKELELNQRTAPEIYLDVLALERHDSGYRLVPLQQSHAAIEYVIQMNQFDPNDVLSKYLKREPFSNHLLESLVNNIVKLHQSAEVVAPELPWGTPEIVLKPMTDNFGCLQGFEFPEQTLCSVEQIKQWTLAQAKSLAPIVTQRKQDGFVRACHGDLHIDNIAVIAEQAVLFDGIEFNEQFRCIDVISDLAFLLVDLTYRGHAHKAMEILGLYLHQTQDYAALQLLPYYMVYRAMVRAKIAVLRAQQCDSSSSEFIQKTKEAKAYIELACDLTLPKSAQLILMQGASGSGKSFVANQLLELLPAIVMSSDRTRKQLFQISALTRVSEQDKSELYSAQMNAKTYQALQDNAKLALSFGFHVIVDATFLKREHREHFYRLAKTLNIKASVVSLQPEPSWAERAIKARMHQDDNPSDATIEVMRQQLQYLEPPQKDERAFVIHPDQPSRAWPETEIKDFLTQPI